jgi:LysR family transcriptional regulator for metE and metH
LPALVREDVDLVISSDPEEIDGITFTPLFDYEPRVVVAASHPLAQKPFAVAEDFRDEVLITYPMERSRLDVFTGLLNPARVEPRGHRQVELTAMILLLVASGRGITVLPDWVLREARTSSDYVTLPLGEGGLTRRMYAATRTEDATKPYMAHFLRLARSEPVKLQRE